MENKQKSSSKKGLFVLGCLFVLLLGVLGGVSVMLYSMGGTGGTGFSMFDEKIAVVEIKGPIRKSRETVKDIRNFTENDSIKGILVRINSPGGAVAPSQEMYHAVKEASKQKPVIASMGSTAASGGYYIACGAETIMANAGTVTGSIGVISQLFNVKKLLDKIDVDVNTVKTGRYKDAGSPFKKFGPAERAYFEQLLSDIYDQFVGHVAESRPLEYEEVVPLADGRVYTGRRAKEHKLVDKIGTFQDAVDYLEKKAGIQGDATLVYPPEESKGLVSRLFKDMTSSAVDGVETAVRQTASGSLTPVVEYRWIAPEKK